MGKIVEFQPSLRSMNVDPVKQEQLSGWSEKEYLKRRKGPAMFTLASEFERRRRERLKRSDSSD